MFFTFLEDARWNVELQAVEFGVEIGEYRVWSGCRVASSSAYCRGGAVPDRAPARRDSARHLAGILHARDGGARVLLLGPPLLTPPMRFRGSWTCR